MRIRVTLEKEGDDTFSLPIHYNHLIQGWIYDSISEELAGFLHDKGFTFGKRKFKLFTFSRLLGRFNISRGLIYFEGPVWLYISTPINKFMREFANMLLRKSTIRLGRELLKAKGIAFLNGPSFSRENEIRMLSPVTAYSTLLTPEGRKKTYYYSPMEREFEEILNNNAVKKCQLVHGRVLKGHLKVIPIKVRESIVIYKGTVIKGWMGRFKLSGPKMLMEIVYEAGLGSKNSEGFGMFEVIRNC
jgi:CRISPR-associated endoribonuclease Cas6